MHKKFPNTFPKEVECMYVFLRYTFAMFTKRTMPSISIGIWPLSWLFDMSNFWRLAMDVHSSGNSPSKWLFATFRESGRRQKRGQAGEYESVSSEGISERIQGW